ncbi:HAMP domain-containing sensor histidine kinase [Rhodocytophaga aerolata]|uniref:histidine kinase n=1 Tax=Rhodocytophaga aerolata TaxID=455078 RepID=A0ABT8R9C3_9BACT|nr:HAMP domain-containing sensor histidine kinase [Rhodocytophaga aerolata]MDO1448698.1 HAMP domain-containing sensor histidine kinase [Rhodocytophaga aerolata]
MSILIYIILTASLLIISGLAIYFYNKAQKELNAYKVLKQQHQELMQNYEQLVSANKELQEAEQYLREVNNTKDKFFSIIAHDLKSPLNTIVGFLQLLNDHVDAFTNDELKNFAGSMNKSVKNLLGLLDNLLQWSRSQTGTIEYNPIEINLRDLINENITLLTGHAQSKGVHIENEIDEHICIKADVNMLHVIFRNLLSNAVKFTRKGGVVNVVAEHSKNFLHISVKDNGVGISPEKLDTIFNLGATYSSNGTAMEKGNGLGLLLCKEFVEKNKGNIRVQSQPGKGSSFTVSLPHAYSVDNILL